MNHAIIYLVATTKNVMEVVTKNLEPKAHKAEDTETMGDGQRKLIKALLKGDLGIGITEGFVYDRAVKLEYYSYSIPVPPSQAAKAMKQATDMLAALPKDVKAGLKLDLKAGSEVPKELGQVYVVVIESTWHSPSVEDVGPIKKKLEEIGDKLLDGFAPDGIKNAYQFVKELRRG